MAVAEITILNAIQKGGPGWLQGAMTLGGGSAVTSLTVGAVYGYEFLWVQPVSMLIGCIMLFAICHQTLSTGEAPYQAMKKYVSAPLAMAWALAALASSVIFGFSHYPLGAGMLEEAISVSLQFNLNESSSLARNLYLLVLAVLIWCICASIVWRHGDGGKVIRTFENAIKIVTAFVVLSFAWVVVETSLAGRVEWGQVLLGYIPTSIPQDFAGVTMMLSALGTAVGINMTFVYGYTLLDRGWGRDERRFASIDVVLGLVFPYLLVTGLISIAAAGAMFGGDMDIQGRLSPANASQMFVDAGMGELAGRLIFPLGILGMVIGTLVMHMLTCGAVASELWGYHRGTRAYRLACLIPTPAILGVFLWTTMGPYLVLPTSAICGMLMPIAYIGWFLLNNNESFLGQDRPTGSKARLFNLAMLLCIVTVVISVLYSTAVGVGLIG